MGRRSGIRTFTANSEKLPITSSGTATPPRYTLIVPVPSLSPVPTMSIELASGPSKFTYTAAMIGGLTGAAFTVAIMAPSVSDIAQAATNRLIASLPVQFGFDRVLATSKRGEPPLAKLASSS
jgi:hypothetical protein